MPPFRALFVWNLPKLGTLGTGGDTMEIRRYVNGKQVAGKALPPQQVDNPVLVRLLRQARARGRQR